MKMIPLLLVLLVLVGCSNKGIYEGVKAGNRNGCFKLPPSQYDQCMASANKSYDEYERERNKTLPK